MRRTKPPRSEPTITANTEQIKRIQTLENTIIQGGLLGRAALMSGFGWQYGGDRKVYQALGYPETDLIFKDYWVKYQRQDIAKAIINRPVDATWRGEIGVIDNDDQTTEGFEQAWKDLYNQLSLKSAFIRLDKLASLGKYGVLMLGFDDTKDGQELVNPIPPGKHKLIYVKPLSELSAKINTWDTNPASARYGLPIIYDVTSIGPGGTTTIVLRVHYTRMIHVPGELLESECEGIPVLQAVYNRLLDLEKLVGGSGEMFWRGARPGYKGVVKEGFTLTVPAQESLQAQIDEYEHNLRRFLINEGVDLEALAMQVADPLNHVEVQIQMISAVTGIPKRILLGSERGELASSEDRAGWLELIQSRQSDYAELQIIRPFITQCQKYGVLPPAMNDEYKVDWPDLFAPSKKELADVGQTRASALQSYMNNPTAALVVPPDVFFEYMMGLNKQEIEHVKKLAKEAKEQGIAEELASARAAIEGTINPEPIGNKTDLSTWEAVGIYVKDEDDEDDIIDEDEEDVEA